MHRIKMYSACGLRILGLIMLSPALLIAAWYDWRHPDGGSYYISLDDLKYFIRHG